VIDLSGIDLNLLVSLDALLAESNVTRASARLNLTQSAVSAQLARLRHLFDDALLIPAANCGSRCARRSRRLKRWCAASPRSIRSPARGVSLSLRATNAWPYSDCR
jgi:DNA-binding transcriptional LysR family regulator